MTSLVSQDSAIYNINQVLQTINQKHPYHDRVDLSINPAYSKVIQEALNHVSECVAQEKICPIEKITLTNAIEKRRMAILLLQKDGETNEVDLVTKACGKDYRQLKEETANLAKKIKQLIEDDKLVSSGNDLEYVRFLNKTKKDLEWEHLIYKNKIINSLSVEGSLGQLMASIKSLEKLALTDSFIIFKPLLRPGGPTLFTVLQRGLNHRINKKNNENSLTDEDFNALHSNIHMALQTADAYFTQLKINGTGDFSGPFQHSIILDGIQDASNYLQSVFQEFDAEVDRVVKDFVKDYAYMRFKFKKLKPHIENFKSLNNKIRKELESLGRKLQ